MDRFTDNVTLHRDHRRDSSSPPSPSAKLEERNRFFSSWIVDPQETMFLRRESAFSAYDFPNVRPGVYWLAWKNCGGQWSRRGQAASFYYTCRE